MKEKISHLRIVPLLLLALVPSAASAAAPRSSLPAPFSRFSEADALSLVFPSYQRETGRQSEFPNQQNQPALVRILEARPWTEGGRRALVVFVEVASEDDVIDMLCGNCLTYGLLAVLREDRGRLALVARQDTGPYLRAKNPEDGEVSGPADALWFSGHDEVKLDLAPYRLTRDELLIGARTEHMWIPAGDWETRLQLFRITGKVLKPVFEAPVVEREYPEGILGPVEKTTAILSSRLAGHYYDLAIERKTIRCTVAEAEDTDQDCDLHRKGAAKIRTQRERWTFDGEKYVLKSGAGT